VRNPDEYLPFVMLAQFKSCLFLSRLVFQSFLKWLDLGPEITLDSKIKLPHKLLYFSQCVCVVYIYMYIHTGGMNTLL